MESDRVGDAKVRSESREGVSEYKTLKTSGKEWGKGHSIFEAKTRHKELKFQKIQNESSNKYREMRHIQFSVGLR